MVLCVEGYLNAERNAYVLHALSKAPVVIAGSLFISQGIQWVANIQSNPLPVDTSDSLDFNGTVLYAEYECRLFDGAINPDSLLATFANVEIVVTGIFGPIIGAVADSTSHRKRILAVSIYALGIAMLAQSLLGLPGMLLPVAFLGVCEITMFNIGTIMSNAYLPEITDGPEEMALLEGHTQIAMFGGQIGFLAVIMVISIVAKLTAVQTSALAAICASGMLLVVSAVHLSMFRKRPPSNASKGKTEPACVLVAKTVREFPHVWHCLAGLALSNSATTGMVTLATTYLQTELRMPPILISAMFGVVLLVAVVFSNCNYPVFKRFRPKSVILATSFSWALSFYIFPIVMEALSKEPAVVQFGCCEVGSVVCVDSIGCNVSIASFTPDCSADACGVRLEWEDGGGELLGAEPFNASDVSMNGFACNNEANCTASLADEQLCQDERKLLMRQYEKAKASGLGEQSATIRFGTQINMGVFIFGLVWGILFGFNNAACKILYVELLPGGREAEFFGLRISVHTWAQWVTPTIWIVIIEAGYARTIALQGAICVPHLLSFAIWACLDMEKGKQAIAASLQNRRGAEEIVNFETQKQSVRRKSTFERRSSKRLSALPQGVAGSLQASAVVHPEGTSSAPNAAQVGDEPA